MSRPITFQNNKQPCLNAENLNKMQDELNPFRNLINCKYGTGLISTHKGISYTKNSDGSFTLNGTATGGTSYLVFTDIISLNGTYTLQLVDNNNSNIYMQGMDVDNNYQIDLSTRVGNLITNTINSRYVFSIYVIEGTVLDNVKIYPQLEENTTATSFTPWAGYIVESGSNDNGSYIKYSDGTMICYKSTSEITIDITTAWGSLYEGSLTVGNFPVEFLKTPTILVTPFGSGMLIEQGGANASKTSWGTITVVRPMSVSGVKAKFHLFAIGRWK